MPTNTLQFLDATLHSHDTNTRMPFRFGIAVMTSAPHVFLTCRYDINGQLVSGIAAEGLLPRWFDKSPHVSPEQELDDLLTVIRHAVSCAQRLKPGAVFHLWQQLYAEQMTWARSQKLPPLLAHFGVSMVERTMIDALGRAHKSTLAKMLHTNLLGIDLAVLHSELNGHTPADFLPSQPLARITARHTVGLSDPLTANDLTPDTMVDDGLPQTLEACIQAYGLTHFKLKMCGKRDSDIARLQQLAGIITAACGNDFQFTLDGNEQYRSVEAFRELWTDLHAEQSMRDFMQHLIFVEQPLHRSVALDPTVADLNGWSSAPPMIIDESDAEITDLSHALTLGYVGTSHKNCKGIIKGVANRCLLHHRGQNDPSRSYYMSGEDLVNIGPVALLQDLATQAALGNASVERNGHHYFRGLTMFPSAIADNMLINHNDMYTPFASSARLNIQDGHLSLASVNAAPFGVMLPPPLEEFNSLPLT